MSELIFSLGLIGFVGGVVAIVALFAQRDANREKEKAQKRGDGNGAV